MLILSRKKNEKIIIAGGITVVVVDIRGDYVRLGIEAPKDISVHREEVQILVDRKKAEEEEIVKLIEERKEKVKEQSLAKTLDPVEENSDIDGFDNYMKEIRKRAN